MPSHTHSCVGLETGFMLCFAMISMAAFIFQPVHRDRYCDAIKSLSDATLCPYLVFKASKLGTREGGRSNTDEKVSY